MFEIKVKIAKDGSLTILPVYLEALGVQDGDAVIVRFEHNEIRIFTLQHAIERAQKLVRRYIPEGYPLVDELLAERRTEECM